MEEQKFITPLSHLKALGLEVSLLMGLGKNVSLNEARGLIESGRVLDYLQRDQGVDLTIWKKPQIDEKAYKAALERIPDSKEKYDPWGVARPSGPAKKPKQNP